MLACFLLVARVVQPEAVHVHPLERLGRRQEFAVMKARGARNVLAGAVRVAARKLVVVGLCKRDPAHRDLLLGKEKEPRYECAL